MLLCLGPPLAVGLTGLGLPWRLALAIPPVVALAIGFSRRAVPAIDLEAAKRHPVTSLLCAILVLTASISIARASIYAYDVGRPEYPFAPGDAFRVRHCCLTGYAEAARYLSAGEPIYDREAYRPGGERRLIGPLTVDYFHYPPPFLLLASAVRLVAPDFFDTRRVWFGFQAVVLGATMLLVAWWVGSREGRRVGWLAAGAFALSTLALQSGNYQTTALALSLAGCILASGGRASAGTAMLGFAALSKIFPGILALHVVAWRRPRVTLSLVAWGAALMLLTAALVGLSPFVEFVRDELPRLASGASFPQTEYPGAAQANQSIYGLITKLRHLGLTFLDRSVGRGLSSVYTLVLVVVAIATGWRAGRHLPQTARDRLWMAALWLTILNFASYLAPSSAACTERSGRSGC